MDNRDLFEAIGSIDEDYIAQSENYHFKKRHNILKFALPIAACLVLFFGGFAVSRVTLGSKKAADTMNYKDYNGNYQKEAADAENAVETCKDEQAESAECSVREVSDSEAKAFFEKNGKKIIKASGSYDWTADDYRIDLPGFYYACVNEDGTVYADKSKRYYIITKYGCVAGTVALYYDGDTLEYELRDDEEYVSNLSYAFGETPDSPVLPDDSLIFARCSGGREVIVTSQNRIFSLSGPSTGDVPDYKTLYSTGCAVFLKDCDNIAF